MSRFVDRGAITAAYVGIGMAMTIVVSFTPDHPDRVDHLDPRPAVRAPDRVLREPALEPSRRTVGQDPRQRRCSPGLVTGLTFAALLLLVKAIFFYADSGYPDFNRVDANGQPIPPSCSTGADCVYQRYLAAGRGPNWRLRVSPTAASFTGLYWQEQLSTAGTLVLLDRDGRAGRRSDLRRRPSQAGRGGCRAPDRLRRPA